MHNFSPVAYDTVWAQLCSVAVVCGSPCLLVNPRAFCLKRPHGRRPFPALPMVFMNPMHLRHPNPQRPALRLTSVRPEVMSFALALYTLTVLNIPFWRHTGQAITFSQVTDYVFLGAVFTILLLLMWLVFDVIAHRYIFKPLAALLIVLASITAFYGAKFGTLFDVTMVQNVLETDRKEATDLLSWQFAIHLALTALLPIAALMALRVNYRSLYREVLFKTVRIAAVTGVVLVIALPFLNSLLSVTREHSELRYRLGPLNVLGASISLARKSTAQVSGPLIVLGDDAKTRPGPPGRAPRLLVIVVGETARAKSFGVLGYDRPTTPRLAALKDLVAFRTATSCGTATAHSMPCMFSNLGRASFTTQKSAQQENLLDVLRHAGVNLLWRDNQSGHKGLAARIPSEQTNLTSGKPVSFLPGKGLGDTDVLDIALLDGLQARIDGMTGDAVIALHMMGSHGPAYYKRYDAERRVFRPDCTSPQFNQCSAEALVNAYDNSIHYTDHVLGELAVILKATAEKGRSTGFIYMSDHGESLGERGVYLHGMPYGIAPSEQTQIPFLAWLSPRLRGELALDAQCVDAARTKPTSHDNLFHTVLGLMDISTRVYSGSLDVFSTCRND